MKYYLILVGLVLLAGCAPSKEQRKKDIALGCFIGATGAFEAARLAVDADKLADVCFRVANREVK